jgi:hypothetical protein
LPNPLYFVKKKASDLRFAIFINTLV